MYYNILAGEKISALGLGAMRFPMKDGKVIEDKTQEIINYAYLNGINYFDTGYKYLNGESEKILGKYLNVYPRDTWNLATKMPGHMMVKCNGNRLKFRGYMRDDKPESVEEIFENQLKKCNVEYFDFYLLHNVNDKSVGLYSDDEVGIIDYLLLQKEKGRVHHLGFSTHGSPEMIDLFLKKYKGVFEFVQIQLNYFDWYEGSAKKQYDIISSYGLPITVMEPCRGGRLANLDSSIFDSVSLKKNTGAGYALRFLQSVDNVAMTLSGMSDLEQLEENVKTFEKRLPLNSKEKEGLTKVARQLKNLVLCTGCSYCMESCPKNIEIPDIIEEYNKIISKEITAPSNYIDGEAAKCISCKLCALACPQSLKPYEITNKIKMM